MEWLPLLFSGVSSLVGGWMGNNAAEQATKQQAQAIQDAMKFQTGNLNKVLSLQDRTTGKILGANRQATDKAIGALKPWMKAGVDALEAYSGELGLATADGQPYQSKFRETPGYQFAVKEAEKGAVNNMRALGMGGSGAALKALSAQRMGMADQTYNQYLDRLKGVADSGQGAATNASQVYMQSGANAGNAMQTGATNLMNAYLNGGNQIAENMVSLGGVQAAGTVGGTNAWTGALSNFANSAGRTLGNFGTGSNWGSILGGAA